MGCGMLEEWVLFVSHRLRVKRVQCYNFGGVKLSVHGR